MNFLDAVRLLPVQASDSGCVRLHQCFDDAMTPGEARSLAAKLVAAADLVDLAPPLTTTRRNDDAN